MKTVTVTYSYEVNKPDKIKPDLTALRRLVDDYMDDVAMVEKDHDHIIDEDFEHYIFETAVETFYGKKVWDYINERNE